MSFDIIDSLPKVAQAIRQTNSFKVSMVGTSTYRANNTKGTFSYWIYERREVSVT